MIKIDKELVLKLLEIFRPKYYNRITWTIVIAGISLLSTGLFEEIIRRFITDKFRLYLLNDNEEIFGLVLVAFGLTYNWSVHYLEIKKDILLNADKVKEYEENKLHDKSIFNKSSELMDENRLTYFLNLLENSHLTKDAQYNKILEWTFFFEKISSNYLIKEIEVKKKSLLNDMDILCGFIGKNFFSMKGDSNTSYLQPELNSDRSSRDVDNEDMKRYNQLTIQMLELSRKVTQSYHSYRMTIKEKLKI